MPGAIVFLAQELSPQYRERSEMPGAIVFLAQELGRFSKEELANLTVQINLYQVLDSELIPEFDDNHDRLDHYWREIFKVVEDKLGEKPN